MFCNIPKLNLSYVTETGRLVVEVEAVENRALLGLASFETIPPGVLPLEVEVVKEGDAEAEALEAEVEEVPLHVARTLGTREREGGENTEALPDGVEHSESNL
jgi:hypothetical protein